MATLRDDLLPVVDDARGLLDDLGLRLFSVSLRTITWSGDRVGVGSPTTTNAPLTLDGANHRLKLRRLSGREVLSSGGRYQDGDYRIGPLTPLFVGGGGHDTSFWNPSADATPREVYFQVTGPGLAGVWFKLVDQLTDRTMRYEFTLRRTNATP